MKSLIPIAWRVLAVTIAMLLIMELAGRIIYGGVGAIFSTHGIDHIGEKFVFNLLITAALVYPVLYSRLKGWQLFGAIAVAYFGIGVFLTMIEAMVFLTQTSTDIFQGFANGTIQAIVLAAFMVIVFKYEVVTPDLMQKSFSKWAWLRKFLGCAVCYVILYLIAGFLIFQHVSDFYATQDAPFTESLTAVESAADSGGTEELAEMPLSPALFFPFQLFRGSCYVAFALPLLLSIQSSRAKVALAVAFLFPMIAGVASLIIPNDFMPAGVRHIHMIEIGWSNFVYGLLVGFVFCKFRPVHAQIENNGLADSRVTA